MLIAEIYKFSIRLRRDTLTLLGAAAVGIALGGISLYFSPRLVLGMIAGLSFFFITFKKPEIILLSILGMTSTILATESIPSIPGFSSVKVTDLVLAFLLGLVIVRALVNPDFKVVHTPLDFPLLAFYGLALASTLLAVVSTSLEPWRAYSEISILSYYLLFFVVTNLLRNSRQLISLIQGFLLLATAVAIAMIVQFFIGESSTILSGRVETLNTQGVSQVGITRILPPGQSLILVAFITQISVLPLNRFKASTILKVLMCGIVSIALILTFSRSFWLGTGLALLLLTILFKGQDKQRFIRLGITAIVLASALYIMATLNQERQSADLVKAAIERLSTATNTNSILEDQSFRWRYPEYEHAFSQIIKHPLMGIGFGVQYRPRDMRIDSVGIFDGRAYLHNGHLWILTKSGLLGYLSFMWLSSLFIARGFTQWRRISNTLMRGCVLGFTLTYLSILIIAVVTPIFMQEFWTPAIGIMMGTNEAIFHFNSQNFPKRNVIQINAGKM